MDVDFLSGEPIFLQIVRKIKEQVESSQIKNGEQLPPVRHLAEELGVNFNTVARAYRILDEEGYLSTQHGRGTFVIGPPARKNGISKSERLESVLEHGVREAVRSGHSKRDIEQAFQHLMEELFKQ